MERGARVRLTGPRTGALVLATAALVTVTSGTAFVAITAALDGVSQTPSLQPLPSPAPPPGRAPLVALPPTTDEPRPGSLQPASRSRGAQPKAVSAAPTEAPTSRPSAPPERGNGDPRGVAPTETRPAEPQPETQQSDERRAEESAERERDRERDERREDRDKDDRDDGDREEREGDDD